ncbi:hypothetical protein HMPREF0083_02855 [Aneurinibacillus aneurinilyticus ATCC 12856]|uniref:Uncharacterized protein n=1 Tax=Aneurinibacillus aneurinilyticus ATCC 12856 TaxID=649747 RepID=U1YAA9_ANEAE|nr:hypothetical protein HMPREF0083_02855 [Aneurinibacillus aneurinilyticus ATCC 12856]
MYRKVRCSVSYETGHRLFYFEKYISLTIYSLCHNNIAVLYK